MLRDLVRMLERDMLIFNSHSHIKHVEKKLLSYCKRFVVINEINSRAAVSSDTSGSFVCFYIALLFLSIIVFYICFLAVLEVTLERVRFSGHSGGSADEK